MQQEEDNTSPFSSLGGHFSAYFTESRRTSPIVFICANFLSEKDINSAEFELHNGGFDALP